MPRGHIQRRDNGTFRVFVEAGRDPFTHKRRKLTATARTRDEAERLLTKLQGEVDQGRQPASGVTVAHLLRRWLDIADLEMTTRHVNEGYIRRTILPALGDMRLVKLTPDVLDSFYSHLRARGGVGGRPLAPGTVRKVHFILQAACGYAVRWGWLPSNPAELASPPKFVQREVRPPSPEELGRLLDAAWAADPDFGTLLWLDFTTGARRAELCGLRWSAVDLERREILFVRSYVQRGRHHKEKDTKTHQGRRLALDDVTVELLGEHLERCRARAAACGVELPADAFVFSPHPDGHAPLAPDSVSRRVLRLSRRIGMPAHLHQLRHYSATQLLAAGVDLRTVAGRLGHGGGGSTTLRVYAHFLEAPDRRAAELIGRSLPRPGTKGA
jgi:integrase